MKFKTGDKVRVRYIDMDGVIVAYGIDDGYAVKIEGFDGHNCEYVIRSGDLSSLENDGWWCGDEDLTLIEPAKAEKSKFKAGDKVELIQSNGVRSEGDIIELERLSCSGIWMDTEGYGNEESWFKLHKPKDSIVKSVRKDLKDRPNRYKDKQVNGMDVIDLVKYLDLNFNEGNILKYLLRDKGQRASDLQKIADYAQRELKHLTNNK